MRVRLAMGQDESARRDVEQALTLASGTPEAMSRAWAAAELVGARCEAHADGAVGDTRVIGWRRCELEYRRTLLRLGARVPVDVVVRAHVAFARTSWAVGDDAAARREARIAIGLWQRATHDAIEDPYVDGAEPLEAQRAVVIREAIHLGQVEEQVQRCVAELPSTGRRVIMATAAREICLTRLLGPDRGGRGTTGGAIQLTPWYSRPFGTRGDLRLPEAPGGALADWSESDPIERAREGIAELRFEFARRTYTIAAAELEMGVLWPVEYPMSLRFYISDRESQLRSVAEQLPRLLLSTQLDAVIATGNPRWRLRALALDARIWVDLAHANRVAFEECRDNPAASAGPFGCDHFSGVGERASYIVNRCLGEAEAARDREVTLTCAELRGGYFRAPVDEELRPTLQAR